MLPRKHGNGITGALQTQQELIVPSWFRRPHRSGTILVDPVGHQATVLLEPQQHPSVFSLAIQAHNSENLDLGPAWTTAEIGPPTIAPGGSQGPELP